ncbi:hypothetical protein [Aromatoleum anaerobium]|uniref:hypothetical protein n=1 Tax=Aromatoleum anaerobium TaxID=182180 RepID=UPI001B7CE781|nr:hypothetical protein [Aromatoleum anaerobium]MCK0508341.1 hypothetical protein [Aromatoleum anaerobium]
MSKESRHGPSRPGPADPPNPRYPVPDAEDTNLARPPVADELPLPHERDEAPDRPEPEGKLPRKVIEQAARDIRRGLRDTAGRGIPSDVPGPGVPPERSPGADVPPETPEATNRDPREDERRR